MHVMRPCPPSDLCACAARSPRLLCVASADWLRMCEEWAVDYKEIAGAAMPAELLTRAALASVRKLELPCLVMGSKGDVVCDASKMQSQLTPALGRGAKYVDLPFDGGHQIHADPSKPGQNGNLYDLAGPLIAQWVRAL